ncbi:DNA-3-methyladenine glycosylase [Schlesneria paludicola]|uniref:DNA-3-methyladenine glycosylase n=1 Tax=Schlesneria paludicola TaxID=360056 RepID=UPI00029AFC82|nr:DNA-3-methyladenine glycosylase [Schlesneria paludicola]
MKLEQNFFAKPAIQLAQDLIGKVMVRRIGTEQFRARIVETEAYVGAHDLACHAAKGRTKRTEVMFGPSGRAYVYLIYGMYDMFNVVAAEIDDPQAVLIRAAEPLDGWPVDLSGPGKFARAFGITRRDNELDLTGDDLYFIDDPHDRPQVCATPRIGIDYAEEWKHELLRFVDPESDALSSRKWLNERR